jgi:hypothetical protein
VSPAKTRRALNGYEAFMKISELVQHLQENAQGQLSTTPYQIHLDLEAEARLAALQEMYPKHHVEELLGELLGAALDELEATLPYVKGSKVVATDEMGDPLYEDIGLTPRFLALSRNHLQRLSKQHKQTG